jgi:hypothetical protein
MQLVEVPCPSRDKLIERMSLDPIDLTKEVISTIDTELNACASMSSEVPAFLVNKARVAARFLYDYINDPAKVRIAYGPFTYNSNQFNADGLSSSIIGTFSVRAVNYKELLKDTSGNERLILQSNLVHEITHAWCGVRPVDKKDNDSIQTTHPIVKNLRSFFLKDQQQEDPPKLTVERGGILSPCSAMNEYSACITQSISCREWFF